MKPIQMVDLGSQYARIKGEIDACMIETAERSEFIGGPHVQGLQQELQQYLNVKHVIGCANGTDALQIALMAIGAQRGDEVITPSFTYIATCEVIALLGLVPVFVEVDEHTFTIDPAAIAEKITPKTKAIIPVHLYGQCADMEPILALAAAHGISVIEDTAQALGSYYTRNGQKWSAGTMGHIGTTSFFPSKNLGCFGDGGAFMTNDDALAAKLKMIANHGQSTRYYHDSIGVNSRLDNLQAGVLRIKLQHLSEYVERRMAAAGYYDEKLSTCPGITIPVRAPFSTHGFHQYTIKVADGRRDALQKHLAAASIPSNIYYPVPVHLQKGYAHYGYKSGDMPLTERLTSQVLSLPIHTELEPDQLAHITASIISFMTA